MFVELIMSQTPLHRPHEGKDIHVPWNRPEAYYDPDVVQRLVLAI